MNHLVLKAVHLPAARRELLAESRLFFDTWLAALPSPERPLMERHVAALLPCLMLARVDGKSPVEYLNAADQATVRNVSSPLIAEPRASVAALLGDVASALGAAA
jgi:hypothetical protein